MKLKTIVAVFALLATGFGPAISIAGAEGSSQPDCPGEKRALVLSGGGVRGAYQIGALWYLVTVAGCRFDHFVGTSTGALTAAVLAEADGPTKLRERVDELVQDYMELKNESDIVSERRFPYLRLILPRWLGGINGTATLDPIVKKLSTRMSGHHRSNLTVAVVSLQAGKIDTVSHRPESMRDFIVGSASIPVGIEPRRARLWVRALPTSLENDVLRLHAVVPSGMPDPECRIRLAEGWIARCEDLTLTHKRDAEELRVRLFLSKGELDRVAKIVKRTREAGLEWPMYSSKMHLAPFEVTTMHQLVDGGVTDQTPLKDALQARPDIDYFFVLYTGNPPYTFPREEFRGGIDVGKAAFALLWEAYQNAAIEADLASINFRNITCRVKELSQQLPVSSELYEKLESLLPHYLLPEATGPGAEGLAKQCESRYRMLTIEPLLLPAKEHQIDTLKPDPKKIRNALYVGCLTAAHRLAGAGAEGADQPPFARTFPGTRLPDVAASCDPLKP